MVFALSSVMAPESFARVGLSPSVDRLRRGARSLSRDASSVRFVGLVVPDGQAQWIEPGVEYNSGAYWRVYGSVLRYRLPDGSEHDLPVTSLISWRGEWYVVHLGAIR